jgi:hypothetical protein
MEKMKRTRRKFSSEFKSQVAIEALKERYTLTELAQKFELIDIHARISAFPLIKGRLTDTMLSADLIHRLPFLLRT